jgi:hypothetical protein
MPTESQFPVTREQINAAVAIDEPAVRAIWARYVEAGNAYDAARDQTVDDESPLVRAAAARRDEIAREYDQVVREILSRTNRADAE